MKNQTIKSAGSLLIAGSLASFLLFAACSPKKDVAAIGTQPVQYRLVVKDSSGNSTYSQPVTANE